MTSGAMPIIVAAKVMKDHVLCICVYVEPHTACTRVSWLRDLHGRYLAPNAGHCDVASAVVHSAVVHSEAVKSAAEPSAAVPSAAVPSAAVSSAAVPSAAVPSAAAPSAAAPSAAAPSAAAPRAAVPNAAVTSAAVPSAVVPSATVTSKPERRQHNQHPLRKDYAWSVKNMKLNAWSRK